MSAFAPAVKQVWQQAGTATDPAQRTALQISGILGSGLDATTNGIGWGADAIQQALQHLVNPSTKQSQAQVPPAQVLAAQATPPPTSTMSPQQMQNIVAAGNFHEVTPQPTTPPATATPVQQAASNYQQNITIPNSQTGVPTQIPPGIAQILMNSFDAQKQATNAAMVLQHPASNSFIPSDPQSNNHINHGENASFRTSNVDATNSDGSIDRGLMRINSNTFKGMMSNPTTKALLASKGITSFDDMNDPQKNADTGAIIQQNGGWERWFAAPRKLRE